MLFYDYFLLYGCLCFIMTLIFYHKYRKTDSASYKFFLGLFVSFFLIIITFFSVNFLVNQQYWLLSKKIIVSILYLLQYVMILILYGGFLHTVYTTPFTDSDKSSLHE